MNKIYNMICLLADFIESLVPEEHRKCKYKKYINTILFSFMILMGLLYVFHAIYYHNTKTILIFITYLLSAASVVYFHRKYING